VQKSFDSDVFVNLVVARFYSNILKLQSRNMLYRDGIVYNPINGTPQSCAEIESAGQSGQIDQGTCPLFSRIVGSVCGCMEHDIPAPPPSPAPAPVTTAPLPAANIQDDGSNMGVIVGVVLSLVVALALVGLLLLWRRRRKLNIPPPPYQPAVFDPPPAYDFVVLPPPILPPYIK
jgi:hypothetical protein